MEPGGETVKPSTDQDFFHRGTQVNGQGFGSTCADFRLEGFKCSFVVVRNFILAGQVLLLIARC